MQIEQRDPKKLRAYERNPKTHPEKQLHQIEESIKEWGFTQPILVDETDQVIAGHGRLEAALRLKLKKVPVIVAAGWTEAQKRAYVIADNKIAAGGTWNMDLLEMELAAIIADDKAGGLAYAGLLGFQDDELNALVSEAVAGGSDAGESRSSGKRNPSGFLEIRIGARWAVQCTEEERDLFVSVFRRYCDDFGLMAGFIGWACRKRSMNPNPLGG